MWVCRNLCLWPVKSVETWAWHARLAPVLIRVSSFLLVESNGWNSCATSRDTRWAQHYQELFTRGRWRALPFHSWRGVVLKEIIEQLLFLHLFYFWPKSVNVFDQKGIYEWESVFNWWLIPAEAWFLICYLDFNSVKLSRTRPHWD